MHPPHPHFFDLQIHIFFWFYIWLLVILKYIHPLLFTCSLFTPIKYGVFMLSYSVCVCVCVCEMHPLPNPIFVIFKYIFSFDSIIYIWLRVILKYIHPLLFTCSLFTPIKYGVFILSYSVCVCVCTCKIPCVCRKNHCMKCADCMLMEECKESTPLPPQLILNDCVKSHG